VIYVYGLILLLMSFSEGEAGAPPPDVIPWDSVVVLDTVYVSDRPVVDARTVYFITRAKYEAELLGIPEQANIRLLRDDIELVKKAIRAKKAGP